MKIINFILLINFLFSSIVYSQIELVENGDFEMYISLPQKDGDFNQVKNWFNPSTGFKDNYNYGTPDYFHLQGTGEVKMPYTKMGTVFANSGKGCIGLIIFTDNDASVKDFREYVFVKLKEPLIIGNEYKIKLSYTQGIDNHYGMYQCENLGFGFSKNKPNQVGNNPIIEIEKYLFSNLEFSIDWVEISATFTASDRCQYLTIGNFWTDENTSFSISDLSSSSSSKYAYIFIDDVSLLNLSALEKEEKVVVGDTPEPPNDDKPIEELEDEIVVIDKPIPPEDKKTEELEKEEKPEKETVTINEPGLSGDKKTKKVEEEEETIVVENEPDIPSEKKEEGSGEEIKDTVNIKDFEESVLKGKSLKLDIYFEADSFKIVTAHFVELNRLKTFLDKYVELKVEIGGHTNGRPEHEYCDWLSLKRVNAIRDYLIVHGVHSSQILAKGYGKRKPKASNRTRAGRKKNQRVEVKLIKKYNPE